MMISRSFVRSIPAKTILNYARLNASSINTWRELSRLPGLPTTLSTQRSWLGGLMRCQPQSTDPGSTKPSKWRKWVDPVKDLHTKHGYDALIFHTLISAASLSSWFFIAKNVDLTILFGQMGILSPTGVLLGRAVDTLGGGTFAYGYIMHKLIAPLRVLITLFISPKFSRFTKKNF